MNSSKNDNLSSNFSLRRILIVVVDANENDRFLCHLVLEMAAVVLRLLGPLRVFATDHNIEFSAFQPTIHYAANNK